MQPALLFLKRPASWIHRHANYRLACLLILLYCLGCANAGAPPTAVAVPSETPKSAPTVTSPPTPTSIPVLATYIPTGLPTTTPSREPTATPVPLPSPTTTPPPTATATPTQITSTSVTAPRLPTVAPNCSPPPCNSQTAPRSGHVDWIELPRITASGEFSLVARVHDGHDLVVPNPGPDGGRLNLIFSDGPDLHGHIAPSRQHSRIPMEGETGSVGCRRV